MRLIASRRFGIISIMKPIATDNYDFERLITDACKGGKRPVTLIGINFSEKKLNIDEPLIEAM